VALPRLSRALRGGLTLLAAVALLTGAEGCARKKIYGESTPTITATVGEQIVIELASNPTTGFTWMPSGRSNPLVVTLMTSDFEPNPSSTFGTGGHHRWTYRAVGPGSTTITFTYGRTWEQAPPEKSATFTITVR
jgi:inhibitor of cysteine peptidase